MPCPASAYSSTPENASEQSATPNYPVEIEPSFGTAAIPEEPENIITLDFAETDTLLSLGITPTTHADSLEILMENPFIHGIGDRYDNDLFTWASGVNVEAIANHSPDLIVSEEIEIKDRETWEKLNSIAPTVVSRSAQAAEVADRVNRSYTDAAGELPPNP